MSPAIGVEVSANAPRRLTAYRVAAESGTTKCSVAREADSVEAAAEYQRVLADPSFRAALKKEASIPGVPNRFSDKTFAHLTIMQVTKREHRHLVGSRGQQQLDVGHESGAGCGLRRECGRTRTGGRPFARDGASEGHQEVDVDGLLFGLDPGQGGHADLCFGGDIGQRPCHQIRIDARKVENLHTAPAWAAFTAMKSA